MDNVTRILLQGAAGAAGGATYVDDVFHTEVFKSTNQNADYKVTNNIDNAGEGGFLWYKQRNGSSWHLNWDTARGSNKYIYSNSDSGESTGELLKSFDSDGYTIKTGTTLVDPARENVLWNFRKAPGFFDVVTYTGTGSARSISHNLGCIPGMVMVKKTDSTRDWTVYHRSPTVHNEDAILILNKTDAVNTDSPSRWGNGGAQPTSTTFNVGWSSDTNADGATYVMYLFAGGASTAATAKSVTFNQNYIKSGSTSDYTMGTGDFTVECWWKPNEIANQGIFQISDGGNGLTTSNWENSIAAAHNGSNWVTYGGNGNGDSSDYPITEGVWYHVAYVRTGGSHKLYVNGMPVITRTDSTNYYGTTVAIGGYYSTGYTNRGEISNFRITKGQALYTTSFKPSIAPLTTTSQGATASNVKLLCCNDASVTGSTVTGATISVGSGSPAASTLSPFDDPEGYLFGEEEDQNLIKCGEYIGSGSAGLIIDVGFEPQWILIKRTQPSQADNWVIWDSMRGIVTDGDDYALYPDLPQADGVGPYLNLTTRGWKFTRSSGMVNTNNNRYSYVAIRRPDGLVGKPPKVGTDVFAMDVGNSSSTVPTFDSGFPVDFAIMRNPGSSDTNHTGSRLTGTGGMRTNGTNPETDYGSQWAWDSNAGWVANSNYSTSTQSWMWKRHAGFDVATWTGDSSLNRPIPHSLGKVPEMIWTKDRSQNGMYWRVYHKNLHSTTPWAYGMSLNQQAVSTYIGDVMYGNQLPTSNNFFVGRSAGWDGTNRTNYRYLSMLFASVDGISKTDYYNGSDSNQTIEFGFTPRFVIIKSITRSSNWWVFDTVRGWSIGNAQGIRLDISDAQTNYNVGEPTSTGMILTGGSAETSKNGFSYLYYAHA